MMGLGQIATGTTESEVAKNRLASSDARDNVLDMKCDS
jgi:hypothetical protein